jgi:hypothetical protein
MDAMTVAPVATEMTSKELEQLKTGIMAEIESKLSQKEGDLWKRGQVEIKRLQQDQQGVKDCIGKIQDRQASLLTENQAIRGALVEVTSRLETVVKEMREVLRTLPQRQNSTLGASIVSGTALGGLPIIHDLGLQPSPTPSAASTASLPYVTEALREEPTPGSSIEPASVERLGSSSLLLCSEFHGQPSPEAGKEITRELEEKPQSFCTPPRNSVLSQDTSIDAESQEVWPRTSGSPAVLSLANSLPPASTNSPTPNTSSPGACKRLQLAECLNTGQVTPMPAAAPPLPASARVPEKAHSTTSGVAMPSPSPQFDYVVVEISKEPGFSTLGIEVNQVDGVSLRVEGIDDEGLVGNHNSKQDQSANRVHIGDRIIEVNGVKQDPNLMLQECKVRQRLSFVLARDSRQTSSMHQAAFAARPPAEDDVDHSSKQAASPPSPVESRLRPEASVFVPAAVQEVQASPCVLPAVAVGVPGFEGFDTTGLLTLPTGTALGTQFASMLEATNSMALASVAGGIGLQQPPTALIGASTSMGYDNKDDEEVKRALFP